MTVWGLPPQSDATSQRAVCEQLGRAIDDHWRLGLECADRGLWDAWAEHQLALERVMVALRNEAREHAGWSVAA
jgi:hypothetical protein